MKLKVEKRDEMAEFTPSEFQGDPIEVMHIFGRSPRELVDDPKNIICACKYIHDHQSNPVFQKAIYMKQCLKFGSEWIDWAKEAARKSGSGKQLFLLCEFEEDFYDEHSSY